MVNKISENVWKIVCNSNIYILKINNEFIAIDAGDRSYHDEVKDELKKIVDPDKVSKVLLTHLHCDHTGCVDLFPSAEFFASKEAIEDYNENSFGAVLGQDLIKKFGIKLNPLPKEIAGLKVIKTPGHSRGSVCFYLESRKVLFSGDTLFSEDHYGRVDLPTSAPELMQESLAIIPKFKILCPGHDYDL
jgi:glyoxylase-like metal-dependent hydrolase (beta-lactamase superfamily II)